MKEMKEIKCVVTVSVAKTIPQSLSERRTPGTYRLATAPLKTLATAKCTPSESGVRIEALFSDSPPRIPRNTSDKNYRNLLSRSCATFSARARSI
jgi:hypothetical protein